MHLQSSVRIPSFRAAFLGSVVVLLTFAAWAFLDRSYFFFSVIGESWLQGGYEISLRRFLFVILALAGVGLTSIVFFRLIFGDRQDRSVWALLMFTALTSMWLTLFVSSSSLAGRGFRWQVHRMLPGLKADASLLVANWPTKNGVLPFVGSFEVDGKRPWLLTPIGFIESAGRLKFSYQVEPHIEKSENGHIKFYVDRFGDWVQYRPDGSEPPVQGSDLTYEELEPHWFLVRNEMAFRH